MENSTDPGEHQPGDLPACGRAEGRSVKARILRYDRVLSTQDLARELVALGAQEGVGTAIVATEQERGRGRHGRTWLSPRGGLYASFILTPDPLLPLRAGVALAQALGVLGIYARLKWPNDVLVAERKIAGILIEVVNKCAIVGIGVNIEQAPLPTATCVWEEASESITRNSLLCSILRRLNAVRPEGILEEYRSLSATIGREVRIEVATVKGITVIRGRATGIDRSGRLLVETDRDRHVITTGECIHLRFDRDERDG